MSVAFHPFSFRRQRNFLFFFFLFFCVALLMPSFHPPCRSLMSRRGGPKKKVKSESGAAVPASSPAAAATPGGAGAAGTPSSAAAAVPAKRLRRRVAEVVYPPGRTAIVYSSLTPTTPMLVYDRALLLDQGFAPQRWACARLMDEVLYLDTSKARFELLADGSGGFVLSRLRDPVLTVVPVADEGKVRCLLLCLFSSKKNQRFERSGWGGRRAGRRWCGARTA